MDSNLPLIYVDPVLVEQAFVQIVDNAAKYSPPGSTINVAAKRNGHDVILSVEDSGAGLTARRLSHLGERFFRGSRHAAIDVRLGPRTVDRQGVRRRQWRHAFTRRARAPTMAPTVSLHLPLAKTRPNPRPIPMTEPSPVVLVVDDEVQIRRFLRAGLELDGFVVQDAETGADALNG